MPEIRNPTNAREAQQALDYIHERIAQLMVENAQTRALNGMLENRMHNMRSQFARQLAELETAVSKMQRRLTRLDPDIMIPAKDIQYSSRREDGSPVVWTASYENDSAEGKSMKEARERLKAQRFERLVSE